MQYSQTRTASSWLKSPSWSTIPARPTYNIGWQQSLHTETPHNRQWWRPVRFSALSRPNFKPQFIQWGLISSGTQSTTFCSFPLRSDSGNLRIDLKYMNRITHLPIQYLVICVFSESIDVCLIEPSRLCFVDAGSLIVDKLHSAFAVHRFAVWINNTKFESNTIVNSPLDSNR